jgi:hypothetical protein
MIFVDDDTWPPSLHGTGGEDYFSQSWRMQRNAFPLNGSIVHEGDVPGYQVSYRFHLDGPVHFDRRIRVTMEHGHANHLADDWSSTAYWYQTLPGPRLELLPVERRLPRRASSPPAPSYSASPPDERQAALLARREERWAEFLEARAAVFERAAEATRARQTENTEDARRVRARFLESLR